MSNRHPPIGNGEILSGACALAMGVSETEVAEPRAYEDGEGIPRAFESAERAFLRTMAARVYLALESGEPRKRHPFASNGRPKFKVSLPPFRIP